MQANPAFDPTHLHAGVWSLASPDGVPAGLEPGTVDIVTMIFVLSALHPDEWRRAVENTWAMLKPRGLLLLRDYGRHGERHSHRPTSKNPSQNADARRPLLQTWPS